MSRSIQYGTITATDKELSEKGYKTLRSQQKVIVEKILWTLKIVLVKTSPYTESFFVIDKAYIELDSEQLSFKFD